MLTLAQGRSSLFVLISASLSLALCAALSSPAYAQAQDGEVATSHPYKLWSPEKPTYLVPSFGLAWGWSKRSDNNTDELLSASHPTMWLGLALHPQADTLSPFVSMGVEIEHHGFDDGGSATYYMPTMRLGVAWQGSCYDTKEINYLTSMFPCATIYGLAGVRPTMPDRTPYMRVGLGVNLFVFTLAGAMAEVLIPSTFEGIIERDMQGSSIYMFRLGFGF